MNFVLSRLHLPTHKASTFFYCVIPFVIGFWNIMPQITERITSQYKEAFKGDAEFQKSVDTIIKKEQIIDRLVNRSSDNGGVARSYPRWDGFTYNSEFWFYFMYLIGLSVLVTWIPPIGAVILLLLLLAFGGISMRFYWQMREFADDELRKPIFNRMDKKSSGPEVILRKSTIDIIISFYRRTFNANNNQSSNAVEYVWLEVMRDLRCCGINESLAHKEYKNTVCCPFKRPQDSCSADEAYQPCLKSHPLGLAIFIGGLSMSTFIYLVAWVSSIIAWRSSCECKARSCLNTTIGCWLRKNHYTSRKIRIFNVRQNNF